MTLEEFDNLEKEINQSYVETIQNIRDYFGNDVSLLEMKRETVRTASEILENSLKLIKQEKLRIRGDL